jgi:hypothetical protein
MIKRLLALAQKLDDAGLTKDADLADKIAQMDEMEDFDASEDWGDDVDGPEKWSDMSEPEDDAGSIESITSQLDALKGMVEEGLADPEQLKEVQETVDSLMSLFFGGGPALVTDEDPQDAQALGGSMELGGPGIEPGVLPVAEAKRRLRRNRLTKR